MAAVQPLLTMMMRRDSDEESSGSATSGSMLYFKIGIMVAAIAFSTLAFLPMFMPIGNPQRRKVVAQHFSSFAGGVFLAIGLQGMLYDGVEHTDHLTEYPLAFMLAGLGYLLVYSAENVLVPWFVRMLYNSKAVQRGMQDCAATTTEDTEAAAVQVDNQVPSKKTASGWEASNTIVTAIAIDGSAGDHVALDNGPVVAVEGERSPDQEKVDGDATDSLSNDVVDSTQANVFALTVVICITLHEFFEGLALGSLTSYDNLWGTLLAIFSHKAVEALATGTAMASATFSRCFSCTLLTIYALSLTIGIGLGMLIIDAAGDSSTAIGVLMGLSAGTFIYIAGVELRSLDTHVWSRLLLVLLGYTVISVSSLSDIS